MKNRNENTMNPGQMLEDMGQVAASLLGLLLDGRGPLRTQAGQKMELLLQRLPFVTRDDFAALHGLLQQARLEQEALKARLAALEGKPVKGAKAARAKNPVNEKLKKISPQQKKSSAPRNKTGRGKR
ncbi:MAG: accessory factor UbiK family protein [Alphaproteobacteria bacterium]|nr:accessory factor UbiK family protein [Alphaproteobacteria bacterium]